MSIVGSDLLADALFARKFIRTIKGNSKYNGEVELVLRLALDHINDAKNGKKESQNYKSSSKDSITLLQAYGTAISVVRSLKKFDGNDCIEEYIESIQKELNSVLDSRKLDLKHLQRTIEYFEQVVNFVIDEETRFSSSTYSESDWQPIIKY